MKQNEEIGVIAIVILLIGGIFLAHNFLGKIKTAPITLVPAGSQSAVNTNGYMSAGTPGNLGNQNANSGVILNSQPVTDAQANAAGNVGIANAIGGTLSNIFGGGNMPDYSGADAYGN